MRAGIIKGADLFAAMHGLQRIERHLLDYLTAIAIIDDQHGTALGRDAARQMPHDRLRCLAPFGVCAVGGQPFRREQYVFEAHMQFLARPALADRQGVEKFVGDNDERAIVGQLIHPVVPLRRPARQPGPLDGTQHQAGFNHVQPCAANEAWQPTKQAQRISHQAAMAGAEFGNVQRWFFGPQPQIADPAADHFAEHLADFRRGGEIAAQWIFAAIIGRVAGRHPHIKAQWPFGGDAGAQGFGEAHAATGLRISASTSSSSPMAMIGRVSVWPMVRPESRIPSCRSGSR